MDSNWTLPAEEKSALLAQVFEDYLRALEQGLAPEQAIYFERYPQLRAELASCFQTVGEVVWRDSVDGSLARRVIALGHSQRASSLHRLGDFVLLQQLGKGGMGIVYEALQVSLQRRVAVKILPFSATLDSRMVQRFEIEARAAATLEHDHIVPVFSIGCVDGIHYLAMRLIDGCSLAELLREMPETQPYSTTAPGNAAPAPPPKLNRDEIRQRVRWLVPIARALAYTHEHGVIHRDVKPGNLLLDKQGKVWLSDFGLARLQTEPGVSRTAECVGTFRYMCPEQASPERSSADHRVDIYSLGVTLYQLVTGHLPFPTKQTAELLQQIQSVEPSAPRSYNRAISRDLDTIIRKAMAKRPADRYRTAGDLANDLQNYLDGQPIQARRPSRLVSVLRPAYRHGRIPGVLLLLVILGFGLGFVISPKPDPEAEYRRDVQPVLNDLARGQPVTVVDRSMRRMPHRWRVGQGSVLMPEDPSKDEGILIRSGTPAVVEILPEVPLDSYIVELRVRHYDVLWGHPYALVGVVSRLQTLNDDSGAHASFAVDSFADVGKQATSNLLAPQVPSSALIRAYQYLGGDRSNPFRSYHYLQDSISYLAPHPEKGPGPWRTIRLQVKPEKNICRWESKDYVLRISDKQSYFDERIGELYPALQAHLGDLPVRGGIGFYLEGSALEVDKLTIYPDPQKD